MAQLRPNCITLNETCLRNRKKMKISGYESFTRNRQTGQIMGGISTSVTKDENIYVAQTKVGEGSDEFIVTRHSNFLQPINIINCYGEQEARDSRTNIEWFKLKREMKRVF